MTWFKLARRVSAALLASSVLGLGSSDARAAEPSPLELTAGVRAIHRSFQYRDTPAELYPRAGYSGLATFGQPLAPSAFLRATLYPFAFSSRGAEANLGLTASYEMGFGTRVVFDENTPRERDLSSHFSEFLLGLRGRLPLGAHELALNAGYGQQRYIVSGDEGSPLVPDVSYDFVRLAVDATLRFDALSVGLSLGTRIVSDTGGLQRDWFPSTRTQAIEARVQLGYQIVDGVALVGGVDLVRYGFDFNPIPDRADPAYVAGGGVDQYTSGWLGARFSLESHAPR
jgi:hypothetical protein